MSGRVAARHRAELELLSPAGNWDCARAAVNTGADAIFFGLPVFNARMRADNFSQEDLPELMKYLHAHGVRGFVTMNTLIFTGELEQAESQLRALQEARVDAVIIQDLGLAKLARKVAPDVELRASTQMTITSPEGLAFVHEHIGLDCAVLARELSLKEITRFAKQAADGSGTAEVPVEVFVHGALCVAYSGQCLTSESLGQRSANRGECAQACRMPYDLVVDGETRELGDQRYLLSPQDLAAVDLIPELVEAGVKSFKIEGRLKSPEYVAAVTAVYRKAIDQALGLPEAEMVTRDDRYALEMTFSRGLSTGWLEGADHPRLTHGRFGKKRGSYLGTVRDTGPDWLKLDLQTDLAPKPGDGVVIATGVDTNDEPGGRIWEVQDDRINFERGRIDTSTIAVGCDVWRTDDPALNKRVRRLWQKQSAVPTSTIDLRVTGRVGEPLKVEVNGRPGIVAESDIALETARNRPLDLETIRRQFGRLGDTAWDLGEVEAVLEGELMLPVSALNRMRRDLVEQLDAEVAATPADSSSPVDAPAVAGISSLMPERPLDATPQQTPALHVLCRTPEQLQASLECGPEVVSRILIDYEDIRKMPDTVPLVREHEVGSEIPVFLATPRIQKSGESGYFRLIERAQPDGVLIRNLGAIRHFAGGDHGFQLAGDFSLNVANPITARILIESGLDSLTISHDLNIEQVSGLVGGSPPEWFELVLHHHMPMFHMEHCVFCTFLSSGKNYLDCGHPCEKHHVQLRDRVGQLHTLKADVGCRNTLFNGRSQTGAGFLDRFRGAGIGCFRVELLDQDHASTLATIRSYRALLDGKSDAARVADQVGALEKFGLVTGTLESNP